jgi:hypothetical protein
MLCSRRSCYVITSTATNLTKLMRAVETMLHLQRTRLLLIVVLGVGSLHGCGFVGFATTEWMNRKDLPEDIRAEQGDDLSDTYYGLLVYLEQMDEHVSLSAKARFVRAHYRKAGQQRANGKAWIERLQGFGRVLRTVMSEGERAKFVELLDDGYYFQVQLKQNIGGVQWRSTKGMYLDGAEPLPNSPRPEKSRKQDDPPQPNPDDLVLPISGAADLLTLDDERLVPIVLRHLLQEPVDPEYETAISAALVTHLETKLQRHEQSQLHVALLRWFTPAEADIIGAIVENDPQLSSRDGLKAEGGSQRPRTARVAFISRLARFDRARARKWTEKFAKDHRKFLVTAAIRR